LFRLAALAVLVLPGFFPASLQAGLIPINDPNAAYQAATNKISITAADGTSATSVTDGFQTVTASSTLTAGTVVPNMQSLGIFPTWGSPPQTESATPRALDGNGAATITFTLSQPMHTFGLEAQPEAFEILNITATFFNGATPIGSITRAVDGLGDPDALEPGAGAKLFAATTTPDQLITSVVLTVEPPPFNDEPTGFIVAQLRYSSATLNVINGEVVSVPEPSTLALLFAAGAALMGYRRLRTRAWRASDPDSSTRVP
jgi:hypothetical protein